MATKMSPEPAVTLSWDRIPTPGTTRLRRPPATSRGWVAAMAGLVFAAAAAAGEVATSPPAPIFVSDVHALERVGQSYELTGPYVPPLSSSQDRRIGLIRKQGSGEQARFVLLAPEKLAGPLAQTEGAELVADIEQVDASAFHGSVSTESHDAALGHFALCDAAEPAPNPRVCGDSDCYHMKVITGVIFSDADPGDAVDHAPYVEMWSRSVTVEVRSPKTAGADLVPVLVAGDQPAGPVAIHGRAPGGVETFHTPMIAADGRLLVVRFGPTSELDWTDVNGDDHGGRYDPVYAVYPRDGVSAPCDISRWVSFKPLANAPFDPDVAAVYDFAKHPFRSPSGLDVVTVDDQGTLLDVPDIPGRYLWLDHEANNIFFASLSRYLHQDAEAGSCALDGSCLYPIACVGDAASCDLANPGKISERTAPHQGWMMAGLWTHGKMVLLDSSINHSDFGLEGEQEHHRMVTLYQAGATATPGTLRVGTGRDATPHDFPHGWIDTTVQLGSTEHAFNMVRAMRPAAPRDVVWQVTAGAKTDEIAFDDYISHRMLIFSPMNALKEMVKVESEVLPGTFGRPYYDGHEPAVGTESVTRFPHKRLQNAATSREFELPAYGEVVAAEDRGRIEHVALGGMKGRGFYLFEPSRIDYQVPDQEGLEDREWVLSLFYDLRKPEPYVRRLLTFPGGGDYLDLHGVWFTRICGTGSGCAKVRLPRQQTGDSWTHLAYHLTAEKVRVFQDGFLIAEVDRPAGMMIRPGTLTVGSPDGGATPGAEGWIDELRVVSGPPNYEEMCNHAGGTLVSIPHHYRQAAGNPLADILQPFADAEEDHGADSATTPTDFPHFVSGRRAVHKALHGPSANTSWVSSDYYVCHVDYTRAGGISVHQPGDPEARSVRRRLLFPEGPVVFDQPRPDSLSNAFCLSCHHAGGRGGLGLEALEIGTVAAHLDTRRQPSQAPAHLPGWLPAGYFEAAAPPEAAVDSAIDQWIHDGPLYRWTLDEAGGTSFSNWVIGDVHQVDNGGTRGQAIFRPGADADTVGRGHGLRFDGIDDSALIAHGLSFDSDQLSLAAWFRPYRTDIGGPGTAPEEECRITGSVHSPCTLIAKSAGEIYWSLQVFYLAEDPQPRWRARLAIRGANNALEALEVDLDDLATPAANDFEATRWHHLAGIYGGGGLEIYLDGASMGSRPVLAQDLATGSGLAVTLGSELDAAGDPVSAFYGRLDDVRVYGRQLRPSEIADLAGGTP